MVSLEDYRNFVVGNRLFSGRASVTDVEISPRNNVERSRSNVSKASHRESLKSARSQISPQHDTYVS